MNVEIDTLVIERSAGGPLDQFEPDLRRQLVRAGVPADHAPDVARSVLAEVRSKVET